MSDKSQTVSDKTVAAARKDVKNAATGTGQLSTIAMVMMTVTTLAGIANDVQMSFYGLSAITYFLIGGILFFIPTGLVAAELASGWSQRGGIFRWVGEGLGSFPAICCLLILWFQTSFSFGSGIPGSSATIGFFTTNYNWAVDFAQTSHSWKITLPIMLCWLAYYWFVCWLATKGIKVFANIAKYGVIFGTLLPLSLMIILAIVWLCQGNRPVIDMAPSGLVPKWQGMSTLALAAGVFFSFAGVDMNAAHIKDLKHPNKQYPVAIFISMILAFFIFVIGTVIIAMMVPEGQINLLYTLNTVFRDLGATIGFPDLYVVIVWLSMANSFAALITNLAGPSYMLGQAGRSGFIPKFLQNNNKHGMPSRMMYAQMLFMTIIAFVVFFLPNVEGFVALITQAITIMYMAYYVLMFVAFLRLRYTQPNRPRGFRVPGGMVGAWVVSIIGIAAALFAIVLAYYPPAQLSKEVGSGANYVIIITCILAVVIGCCVLIYRSSRKHNWVDPNNQFAPFTWQIEGMSKPGKALSNIPTALLSEGQDPMGMPIKKHYGKDEMLKDIPASGSDPNQAPATAALLAKKGIKEPDAPGTSTVFNGNLGAVKTVSFGMPEPVPHKVMREVGPEVDVPMASAEAIAAARIPSDPAADAVRASEEAQAAKNKVHDLQVLAQALENEAEEDQMLVNARKKVREAEAAADQAKAVTAAQQVEAQPDASEDKAQDGAVHPKHADGAQSDASEDSSDGKTSAD